MNTQNQNEKEQKNEKQQGKTQTRYRIIVILLLIIIIILLLFKSCGTAPTGTSPLLEDPNIKAGDLEKMTPDEIQELLNKKVDESMLNISMNLTPTFQSGTAKGDLKIVNSEINRYKQVVEMYRDDTNELVYKSGAIPVGHRIEEAALSVDLPAGTYNCTAYFNAYTSDTDTFVGKAAAKVKVKVLS